MDKNAIKKYAVWARKELITRVSQRAEKYDITADADVNASSVNGILLSDDEKKQRKALIEQVKHKGFDQVMEEVAYTWFNRFIALRFMEVNGYLPSHIRVFTDDNNNFKPQILAEAIHLELNGLNMDKVYEMKNANENDELYKYLIITQCNDLSKVLPGMFQKISDYTELLFPDNVLRENSAIEQMVALIPEEDWKNQVQIIGWLYQYYNSEPKSMVFAKAKGVKIKKEEIPAATQLFTPDWIVKYMVENSLGKIWKENHEEVGENWKYYISETEQSSEVDDKINIHRKNNKDLKPEDLKCIDPCSGSGHILSYMFDVLVEIYASYGVSSAEAVKSIIKNNIFGLDIDERAAQLAYFSIMMKAVQYDRRFLRRKDENGESVTPQPNVYAIKESNDIDDNIITYYCNGDQNLLTNLKSLIDQLNDAKEYGSVLTVKNVSFDLLSKRIEEIENDADVRRDYVVSAISPLIKVGKLLSEKYDVVITNPPYLAVSACEPKLKKFVNKYYPDSKTDLFAVFIERCHQMNKVNGFQAMITMHSWMFLSSYEKLRQKLKTIDLISMAHLGPHAFDEIAGEVVQTTSFIFRNTHIENYRGVYHRLLDGNSERAKEELFLNKKNICVSNQSLYTSLPGSPFAYWISNNILDIYEKGTPLGEIAAPRKGNSTSDNNRFLRLWFEVEKDKMNLHSTEINVEDSKKRRWYPYNKGGGYRKWYGFNEYLIDWYDDAAAIRNIKTAVIANYQYFTKPGLTWSTVSSNNFSIRWFDEGYIFDNGGCCIFDLGDKRPYLIALLNSAVFRYIFGQLNPTLNFQSGEVAKFPVIISENSEINDLAIENVKIAKEEYDSYETSWDFKENPLIKVKKENFPQGASIEKCFKIWEDKTKENFRKLKSNEERINQIFIDIYNLNSELSAEVNDDDVTLRVADLQTDIKALISYAVGCILGRYSLDKPGIAYAGGDWDDSQYQLFYPDSDGIIPITEDEYFNDDIVNKFEEFISFAFGSEYLEENLKYISDAMGGGNPRNTIRSYFVNTFYSDHLKMYQKRPIYWLFDSGKKNGFKCLIYMHRYQPDTIARIRTDYVHEQQARYRTAIEEIENRIASAAGSDKVKLTKKLNTLKAQDDEIHAYEEKIHHLADQMISIDLDDGVKHNYEIFKDVLAKIK